MTISIAERRKIGQRAVDDAEFRLRLIADPKAAVEQELARRLPQEDNVEVVCEAGEWSFVLPDPAAIELDLPDPTDVRSAIENEAYNLLRDNPELRPEAEADPIAFARQWLNIDLSTHGMDLQREQPGQIKILVPNPDERELLSDDVLDLIGVVGGEGGGGGCPQSDISGSAGGPK